jgi:hypothetical protein
MDLAAISARHAGSSPVPRITSAGGEPQTDPYSFQVLLHEVTPAKAKSLPRGILWWTPGGFNLLKDLLL